MLDNIPEQFKDPVKVKGSLSILAAIIMFFTPDYIDSIIEALLLAVGGIDIMKMEKKGKKK
jgi:hypothetical protein